jgi:hypothetical protein
MGESMMHAPGARVAPRSHRWLTIGLGVVVAMAFLSAAAPALAQTSISTNPALFPAFDETVSDYVVRCTAAPVTVTVSASAGTQVKVDSHPAQSGDYTVDVVLDPGQSFQITRSGDSSGSHFVRCLPSSFFTWTTQRPGQPQAEWYMVDPRGPSLPNYVAVFDTNGVPVWWMPVTERAGSLLLLPNGNIGWSQNPPVSAGALEHRLDGSLVREIDTVNAETDFHEFLLLPNGNYLLGANVVRPGFSFCGQSGLSILDTGFQEIAPDGSLVWSWYPSDHISLSEIPPEWCASILGGGAASGVYDPYHFNSAEPAGNSYVLSFRHLDAIYQVSRSTGAVEWKVGGVVRPESLTVLNDPGNGPWGGHDARMLSDGTVTSHDNGFHPAVKRTPRAARYQLDLLTRTATLIEQVNDPGTVNAACCGSARKLPGGNWVMSWGGNPVVTELTPAGSRVFSLTFSGTQFSYRAHPVPPGVLSRSSLRAGMDARYPRRFPRPGGATPLSVPLVPAFEQCVAGDVTHAPPLEQPSCSSPGLESQQLTTSSVGKGSGSLLLNVDVGDPATPEDEADVMLRTVIRDVRVAADGSDYTGPLSLVTNMRITDTASGAAPATPATLQDLEFSTPVDCEATPQPDPQSPNASGATCGVITTLESVVPGFAREGARAVISTLGVSVEDAGPDGIVDPGSGCPPACGTGDEADFLQQGVFAP